MSTAVAIPDHITATGSDTVVSTGIGALDARLGSLISGRHYLISGNPGSGKTTAVLHFLGEGLEKGEVCALLSQDDPDDLLTHADYIGYDLRPAIRENRLILLQFRMDFLRRYSRIMAPELVFEELTEMVMEDGVRPSRLAIDSALPFLEGGHVSNDLIDGLGAFLEQSGSTTYLTLPGELQETSQRRLYDRVVSSAAGVFHIDRLKGTVRELSITKLRQKAHHTDPFTYEIRPGAGMVEEVPGWAPEALPPEVRRRVLVLDEHGSVPAAFLTTLGSSFRIEKFRTLEAGFSEIASGRYGALVLGLDPYRPNLSLDLAHSLRKSGNGVPILFVAPREGLRSSTRARALRAGGDDFIMADAPPVEVLERIDAASGRGHRHAGLGPQWTAPMQPTDPDGQPRPMTAAEFRDAVGAIVAQPTPPLFAVLFLNPSSGSDRAWSVLQDQIRLEDGDLVASLDGERLAVYLAHVDPGTAADLGERLSEAHEGPVEVLRFPSDREQLEDRLGMIARPTSADTR